MTTYVVESAPTGRRGLYASAIHVSSTIGTLAATVLALVLHNALGSAELADWGWRIPFGIGAIAGLYVLYLRWRLRETPVFEQARTHPATVSRVGALRESRGSMLRVAGITAGLTVSFYTFSAYLPAFAQHAHGMSANHAWFASLCAQLVFVAAVPLLGMVSDRFGPRKLLLVFGIGSALLAPVALEFLESSELALLAAMVMMLLLYGCGAVAMPVVVTAMFPTAVRSTGIGVPYALIVAAAGGSAPYLIEYLSEHHAVHVYTGYVALLCLITAASAGLGRFRSAGMADGSAGRGDRLQAAQVPQDELENLR